MLKVQNLAAGLSLSILCSLPQAHGDFYNWGQFAAWCSSTGGRPVPNPPRCLPSAPSPTAPAPNNFTVDRAAYSNLINRISPAIFNQKLFDQDYGTMPENADELSERLVKIYDFLGDLRAYQAGQLDRAVADRNHARMISSEIDQVTDAIDALKKSNAAAENYIRYTQDAINSLRSYTIEQQRTAFAWFKYVTPVDSMSNDIKVYYFDLSKLAIGFTRPPTIPKLKTYEVPPGLLIETPPRVRPGYLVPVIPDADNDIKIRFVESTFREYQSLRKQISDVENSYDRQLFKNKATELFHQQLARDGADFYNKQLVAPLKLVQQSFLMASAESFAWKIYTDHVSIAEAKKFYNLNKSWHQSAASSITDNDVIKYADTVKSAFNIAGSETVGLNELLDVQKKTIDFIPRTESLLLEVPRIIAEGTPEEEHSFLRRVDETQQDFHLGIIEAAKDILRRSPPFSQALKGVTLPAPYMPIARALGLAE
jgi:hypothetical protein